MDRTGMAPKVIHWKKQQDEDARTRARADAEERRLRKAQRRLMSVGNGSEPV
jgi:hypothetical protein